MKISQYLTDDIFPLKYFYCCIDNNEYILSGDENALIYNYYDIGNVGNIIIEVFENNSFIHSIINEYIDKISNEQYFEDEETNQSIIWVYLSELQGKLELSNIKYFRFLNLTSYMSEKFINEFNDINIQKTKYNNFKNSYNNLKNIADVKKNPNNQSYLDNIKKRIKKDKTIINNLEKRTFKNFVIEELDYLLYNFRMIELYLTTYFGTNNNLENNEEKQSHIRTLCTSHMVPAFYGLNCFSKLVFIDNNKLYFDNELLEYVNSNLASNIQIVELFRFDTITDLLTLSLVRIINKKITLTLCLNCNNFFIPKNRSDEKYCDRISPQNPNKTCKQYGAKRTYREQQKEIPITNEHTRTSQFFRMRYKRANEKEKTSYKNQLDNYLKEYKLELKKYRSGKLNEQDFIEWIINQKEGVKNGSVRKNKK